MNAWTFARRSFVHNWRVNAAVMLGSAIATAVITGALVVGDSVRGSLRDLAIQRLGRIDEVIFADRFFRQRLAEEMSQQEAFLAHFNTAIPAVLLPNSSAEHASAKGITRASNVILIGCDERFWKQDTTGLTAIDLPPNSVGVNQTLADQLGVSVGDTVTVRLPRVQVIAADSTLADKSDVSEVLAGLRVQAIIPAQGLGRFSLNPSQNLPSCAFVRLATAQDAVNQPDRVNCILACSDRISKAPGRDAHAAVLAALQPNLDDAGLTLKLVELDYFDERSEQRVVEHSYVSLSTDRMLFTDAASEAIRGVFASRGNQHTVLQPVLTYLANSITNADRSVDIPYSTITAVDSVKTIGPLFNEHGEPLLLQEDEIVLNEWAAADLNATIGDTVTITFFSPETNHGEPTEHSQSFRLAAVAPLVKPLLPYSRRRRARYVDPPAWTNDPDLTPTVPGVSDQETIDDWDPPFPFDYRRIQARKPKDDDYWKFYRTTPKAFVSYATGKRLWGSRFGSVTSFRIDPAGTSLSEIETWVEQAIASNPSAFGFSLIEAKRIGVEAAAGTTPFNILFLSFSFFIMVSAILMLALLFRLNVEQRSPEIGLLLSVGCDQSTALKLLFLEGLFVALVAAAVGVLAGVAYATLMIVGLKTWWVDAIVTPFLSRHITAISLLAGGLLGIVTTCLTILVTLRSLQKIPARQLLSANLESRRNTATATGKWVRSLPWLFLGLGVIAALAGVGLSGESQAGAFFGGGAAFLAAGMTAVRNRLHRSVTRWDVAELTRFDRLIFAVRNAGRNPGRSMMTIGLMAAACFLIIAISAFRLAPTDEGTGGFSLIAESELPIFDDLNSPDKRSQLFGVAAQVLNNSTVLSLRLLDGDDASCRNLYKAQRPRIIGITADWIDYFDTARTRFGFAAVEGNPQNPWELLREKTPVDQPIPVIMDKNTAMYSQHLYGGVGEVFERDYGDGKIIQFRVVGLLSNSVLQGSFLVGEADLRRLFPMIGGYRFFCVQTDRPNEVANLLEDTFQNEGFDAKDAKQVLADLLAVQNTYISTFQSLGGLGLLFGTFGLMAVQLRNVWQRRGEIALLRATGIDTSQIGRIILIEHALLLLGGLGTGIAAAMLTVLPHIVFGGASVPIWTTLGMLLVIATVGLITGIVAVRKSSSLPVLNTLRGD